MKSKEGLISTQNVFTLSSYEAGMHKVNGALPAHPSFSETLSPLHSMIEAFKGYPTGTKIRVTFEVDDVPRTAISIIQEYKELVEELRKVVDDPNLSWQTKYNIVFGKRVKSLLNDLEMYRSYYDPDEGYEDDVRAFFRALEEQIY